MTKIFQVSGKPSDRAGNLLSDYFRPDDVDIDIYVGVARIAGEDRAAIVVQINNGREHGFLAEEARVLADSVQRASEIVPPPEDSGAHELVMLLRHGADKADEALREEQAKQPVH